MQIEKSSNFFLEPKKQSKSPLIKKGKLKEEDSRK